MFNLFLMNFIAAMTALLLTQYFLFFNAVIDYYISFFILFVSQILLTVELLGVVGHLHLNSLLSLNTIILITVYLVIKAGKISPKNNLYLACKAKISNLELNKIQILLLAVILGFALVKVFINLVNPPFGWDDLNYHFTFAVEWLKNHNLVNPIVVSCDPSPTYYPVNGSLWFLWLILPLKNVFIADLGQVPFFILAFFSVYSLARKINLSKEYAFYSASLFTLVPNYFKQLSIAYVDVMVASLFLASLNFIFLLRQKQKGYLTNIILYSLSLGLAIGIKTTALAFAFLLFLPFCIWCYKNLNFKKAFLAIIFSIFFITLAGAFTYIRNFIQTGNPLYPLNLTIFNKLVFKGVIDSAVYKAHTLSSDYNLGKILFSEGLGAQTVIFLLPALFLALPLTIMKKKENLNFNFIYFLILPFLMILSYRFIVPIANLRYIYALLGIGFIIAFYTIGGLNLPKLPVKTLIIICALASAAELAKRTELIISLLASLILFFILPYIIAFLKNRNSLRYIILTAILLFIALIFLERDYVKHEYVRYTKMVKYSGFWPDATKAWECLNRNTQGENIAYVGRPVPFPLYGKDFKNNVYYVSINSVDPVRLEYFPNSKYIWGYDGETVHQTFAEEVNYRGKPDYTIWLNNLFKHHTEYLFIYSLHQIKAIKFPIEDEWAKNHKEAFSLAFNNDTIHIYKIKK